LIGNIYLLLAAKALTMENYIGEIRIFPWNYAPYGWHFCDGTILQIQQNTALYSLLLTTYGGDGKTTFALPDLRGMVPIGVGTGQGLAPRKLGDKGGSTTATLTTGLMATHSHNDQLMGTGAGNSESPAGNVPGSVSRTNFYSDPSNLIAMAPQSINSASVGKSQPHDNMQPYLTLNFCIATTGYYPARE
jgi:microcystin-dependent protein